MAASEDSVAVAETSSVDAWIIGIFILYIAGVLFFLVRMALSLVRIIMMVRSKDTQRQSVEGVCLIIHKKEIAPFSWMRYIVISEKDYLESSREIITHELAHIEGRHSLDLILAEAVAIVHWFNPAAYLLKQELRNIHEYQADEAVINKGIDAKQYQLLLIKKAVGDRLYTMANSFNHSKLKNRITMISKKKSTRQAALKALFVLPMTAFAIIAFASEEVTSKMEVISNAKITEIFASDTIKKEVKKDVVVKETSGKKSKQELKSYMISIDDKDTCKKSCTIVVSDKEKLNSGNAQSGVVSSVDRKTGKSVNTNISFENRDFDGKKPMVLINGKEVDFEVMQALESNAIDNITVLKDKSAAEIYGKKGENGVILINLKNSQSTRQVKQDIIVVGKKMSDKQPLYVINGVVATDYDVKAIDNDNVAAVNVLKGNAASEKFGEKGENGVIMITLKDEENTQGKTLGARAYRDVKENKAGENKISIVGNDKPLIVVNGKIMKNTDMTDIALDTIKSVKILKGHIAKSKYGKKGKNGVIEVTLK